MFAKKTPLTGDKLAKIKRWTRTINFERMKYFWALFFVFNLLVITSQFVYTVRSLGDLVKLMEISVTLTFVLQVCHKLLILYWKQDMIEAMFKTVEETFFDPVAVDGGGAEIELLTNTLWFVYLHVFTSLAVTVYVMLSPMSEGAPGTKTLPMQMWFPFDTNQSPVYEIVFVVLTIDAFLVIYTVMMFDYCFLYFAQHVIVQFKLLKKIFLNAAGGGDICERFHSNAFQAIYFGKIRRCIDHHRLLIKFSKDLDNFASINLGVHLFLIIATAVIVQFLIYWDSGNKIRCFKLILVFYVVFGQLMIYGYVGSELEAMGLDIAIAAFHSQWYVGKKPIRDALIMVQANAQKPLRITAWIFMTVNNGTILWVYRIAFSVFTLLRSFEQGN